MVTVFDVPADALIGRVAEDLKAKLKMPEWAKFVKTGSHKERPPAQADWYYFRAASLLRRIYTDGPVGVEKLRTVYGGRKDRGVRPKHFGKSGGKIIRFLLQELETLKFVKKSQKGRELAPEGRKYLDGFSLKVKKG